MTEEITAVSTSAGSCGGRQISQLVTGDNLLGMSKHGMPALLAGKKLTIAVSAFITVRRDGPCFASTFDRTNFEKMRRSKLGFVDHIGP